MTTNAFEGIKTAKVNGTTLAYREQGEGEPVVFLHGGMMDLRAWEEQLPAVGRSYRAIAYSRRFARPNKPIDPEAIDPVLQHVEDLVTFLNEIDAKPAHLVGHSGGGLVCLYTALRHPDVVRSLVLEEPAALTLFSPTIPPRLTDILHLIATRPRTAIALFGSMFGTMIPVRKALERGEDEEALWIFVRGAMGKKGFEQIPKEIRAQLYENRNELRSLMLHPDPNIPPMGHEAVRRMPMPVLLMTGERSPAFLLRITDRLEELLPIVERVEIPEASHLMQIENAAAFNEAIIGFLGRRRDRPTSPPSR
jgi:pimeloyl-ACP methyl ester carboxylesterase